MKLLKKIIHKFLWIIIGGYCVLITIPYLLLFTRIILQPSNIKVIPEIFTINPWGERRVKHCVNEISVYKNKDIDTIFFKHKDVLDNIKEIGGKNTGFELTLNSWDSYWGCLSGDTDVTVVDYDMENEGKIVQYIESQKVPFKITIPKKYPPYKPSPTMITIK